MSAMALTCPHCDSEIPQGAFGVDEAIEEGDNDEVVAHKYNPDGFAVLETAYYCNPSCFIEHNG